MDADVRLTQRDVRVPGWFVTNHPTLLQLAALFAAENCFDELVNRSANHALKDSVGRSLAHYAVAGGKLNICRKTLALGLDFAEGDVSPPLLELLECCGMGRTPCVYAAWFDRVDVLNWLWMNGWLITNGRGEQDATILLEAAYAGSFETVQYLLEVVEISPDWRPYVHEPNAIHAAAAAGRCDVMQLLADRGASLVQAAKDGMTPLVAAVRGGSICAVMWLLEHGVWNQHAPRHPTVGPVGEAARIGAFAVLDVLRRYGVDF
jgi:ankyrin repeat protein